MSSRQFSVRCLQGPHFYSVFSPPWRVQPGETPLQDCPAPGRRGAYNPAKRHSKIAQRRAGGPRTTRRNATPRLPSAGPEALRPHPPPRRAELIFKSPCDRSTSRSGRRSSVVEQLIRNQQVAGSNPIAGSTFNDLTILLGKHGVSSWINFTSRCPHQPCFLHRQREPLLLACLPLSLLPDSPCGTILPPTNSPYSTFWSNQ